MKPANYTLTLEEWQTLEKLSEAADKALQAFRMQLLLTPKEDDKTRTFLLDMASEVPTMGRLIPYMLHPQPEWTGGDSSDPANTVYREPHVVGNFPGHIR